MTVVISSGYDPRKQMIRDELDQSWMSRWVATPLYLLVLACTSDEVARQQWIESVVTEIAEVLTSAR